MNYRRLILPSLLLACGHAQAQSTYWNLFGPDRAEGAFVNITREHRVSQNSIGVATDPQQRLLILNEWDEAATSNLDCAVTRHIRRARALDMDYTGPEELEGTRRIAADMGGTNVDNCTSIDSDTLGRAVVVGNGDTGSGIGGFIIRLAADGAYDTTFAGDGKFFLRNLAALSGTQSRLNHVIALGANRVVACGSVTRGSNRRMLILRVNSSGQLDTGFNGSGIQELDFNGAGTDADSCARLLVLPGGDLLAGLAEQLEAGAADALRHQRRHLVRHAGVQADVARHIELVEAARRHVAGEHRVDVCGRDAAALQHCARDLDAQVDRVGVGKGAAVVDHRRAHAAQHPDVVEGGEESLGGHAYFFLGFAPSPAGGRQGWGLAAVEALRGPHPNPPPAGEGVMPARFTAWLPA